MTQYPQLQPALLGPVAEAAFRRYRDAHRSAMMQATEAAFAELTNCAYSKLQTQIDGASETLLVLDASGMAKQAQDMSKGTRFQLYLALRTAAYEQLADQGSALPFFCDDIFETFDGMARKVSKWDKHFPRPPMLLTNVIRDDGDAAGEIVLVPKPGMDTFGSVTLLLNNPFVVFQDLIYNRSEWNKLRADRQSSSPIPWGHRGQQDLCHRSAVDPQKTTSCTFAHTINMARPTNTAE